jgi:hypothetical protein
MGGIFAAAEKTENAPVKPLLGRAKEQRIAAIQARHESELLRYPNVVGIATGIRTCGSGYEGSLVPFDSPRLSR